jgi:hypothetical protein
MKFRLVFLLVLIAASGLGAYLLGSKSGSGLGSYYFGLKADSSHNDVDPLLSEQEISGLVVDGATLDLGEIPEQVDYPYHLNIHNRTAKPAEILDLPVSCGCVEGVEPRTLTIAPGGTATVRLKLNLAKRNYGEQALTKRPFEVTIRPVLKASSGQPGSWRLHGIIESRVTLDTLFLDFGDAPVRGQPPISRKVVATVHVPDASLEASVASESMATVAVKRVNGSTMQFELTVAPAPTLPLGPFSCEINVSLITKDGARLSGVVLPVAGKVQPEVRAIPAQLAFGPRRVGQTAESTVTLQVPEGETWAVDHIEIDSPGVRVDVVAGQGTLTGRVFRVRQHVAIAGHQISTVRFFVRKAHDDPVALAMDVSYDGDSAGVISDANENGAEQ